ncbi:MAG: hypothetical protein IPH28_05105 [Cytophagaceae bacterium]|nr:hypothetical protein [Cytophagaceae bacterium]MBK9508896.1 hypothetical protein [Cytophagaceae bacterium]MBK9935804.1 hypothetical protein [Cytophagaceae bacterium]MBL0302236.1 hypothetical protein [Cytophagaceae bacterium]MBL0325062.1 hypothetical protein [Cytophagaceae bacterium]
MNLLRKTTIVAACIIGSLGAKAQDLQNNDHVVTVVIPSVALLDLESNGSKNFNASFIQPTPLEAGQRLTSPNDNASVWINYSSILPSSGLLSRNVTVSASTVVPGVSISVLAGTSSTGAGAKGSPTTAVTLSTTAQNIITGIGSAYTGNGVNYGHNITYSFSSADGNYGDLRVGSVPVTVTYTLVDN